MMAQAFDLGRLELTGEAFPVAEHVGSYLTFGSFSASARRELVHRTGRAGGRQLLWFDREGKSVGTTAGQPGVYNELALAPDGKRVAVSVTGTGADIWLLDPGRQTNTRFTFHAATENYPVWSPDGVRIAFASNRDGISNIYQKLSSGAGNEELMVQSGVNKRPYDWSRDGRFLLYSSEDPRTKLDPATVSRGRLRAGRKVADLGRGWYAPEVAWGRQGAVLPGDGPEADGRGSEDGAPLRAGRGEGAFRDQGPHRPESTFSLCGFAGREAVSDARAGRGVGFNAVHRRAELDGGIEEMT
ncbi:MAG: PD40 domain-containing protein [Acidobacteria bacterium]|nr:PD40 domain-containing protein [Acidobacteriota bacterium]